MDLGLDGEPRSRLIVEVADAVDLYGAREIEVMDRGLQSAQTEVALLQILRGYLRQRTFESAYVDLNADLPLGNIPTGPARDVDPPQPDQPPRIPETSKPSIRSCSGAQVT